jgi:hypothetical protein
VRYTIPDGVLYRELPGEAVVLNLATAEYFQLNNLGRVAWELLRAGADRDSIETTLVREYEAPAEQISSDLNRFLGRIVELKLVTILE